MWIPDLDLVCIGWIFIGIQLGTETDSEVDVARVVDSKIWGWTDVGAEEVDDWGTKIVVIGEWAGKGEYPGGTRGTKVELAGDIWDVWGIELTKGGERLGLRLK